MADLQPELDDAILQVPVTTLKFCGAQGQDVTEQVMRALDAAGNLGGLMVRPSCVVVPL
jgi:hypothetical protein